MRHKLNKATEFDIENYDEFYEHFDFAPVRARDIADAHRLFSRVAWALDIAKEIEPDNILDLGGLDGATILTLMKHTNAKQGVSVDLSEEGTQLGADHAKRLGMQDRVTFVQKSIEDYLELCSETDVQVDMITMFEVIEHVKDPNEILNLICQVLRPGGTLLITTPQFEAPNYGMDDEENKCHIRLYTMKSKPYTAVNKHGNERRATSMHEELKEFDIHQMEVWSELIHVRCSLD